MVDNLDEGLQGSAGSRLPVRAMTLALFGLAAVALVIMILEVAVLRPRHDDMDQQAADRSAVLSVAQRFTLTSNDYTPQNFDTVTDQLYGLLTTAFRTKTKAELTDLRATLQKIQQSSTGTVLKEGIASIDPDSAVVLVVADAHVKNTAQESDRHFRWQVSLDKVGDKWLVNGFEAVQDPTQGATP
jgi:hypothetical protein